MSDFASRNLHWLLTALVVVLFLQVVFPRGEAERTLEDLTAGDCKGTPIQVPFEYNGTFLEPWSCEQQCKDGKQHYLVYTNGLATQCEELPGCNDTGEDNGQTCDIPGKKSITPMSKKSVKK